MNTQRIEIKPDTNNVSLEQSAQELSKSGIVVNTDGVTNTNSGTNTVISQVDSLTQSTEKKPEWLPEKFASAEELAKAYTQLEKKFSSTNKEPVKDTKKLTANNNVAEVSGVEVDRYSDEYAQNGELSEKSYVELEQKGITRDLVNAYIDGQIALSDNYVKEVHSLVGSAEKYDQLTKWAVNNLSPEDVDSFNDIVSNGTLSQAKLAVKGLMAEAGMTSSPTTQTLFSGDSDNITGEVFTSIAQVTKAMNDPRYQKDTAYRKEVEAKLSRSTVI